MATCWIFVFYIFFIYHIIAKSIIRNDTGEYFLFNGTDMWLHDDIICNANDTINDNCFIICNGTFSCNGIGTMNASLVTNISISCYGQQSCHGAIINVSDDANINLLCNGDSACSFVKGNFTNSNTVNILCDAGDAAGDNACVYSIFDLRYANSINIKAYDTRELESTIFYFNGTVDPNNINITCLSSTECYNKYQGTQFYDYMECANGSDCIINCTDTGRPWGCQSMTINATYAHSLSVICPKESTLPIYGFYNVMCGGIDIRCPIDGSCNLLCKAHCGGAMINASQSTDVNVKCGGYICGGLSLYGPDKHMINGVNTSVNVQCLGSFSCTSSQFMVFNTYSVNIECNETYTNYASCNELIVNGQNVNEFTIKCIGSSACQESIFNLSYANQINGVECIGSRACEEVQVYATNANYLSLNCDSSDGNAYSHGCYNMQLYCSVGSTNSCDIICSDTAGCDIWMYIPDYFEWNNFLSITGKMENSGTYVTCFPSGTRTVLTENVTFDGVHFDYGCDPEYRPSASSSYLYHYDCCPWKLNDILCNDTISCNINCTKLAMCEDRNIYGNNALSLNIDCYSNDTLNYLYTYYGYCGGSKIFCPNTDGKSQCNIQCHGDNSCQRVYIYTSNMTKLLNITCYGISSCRSIYVYALLSNGIIDININCMETSSCGAMNIYANNINDFNLNCLAQYSCQSSNVQIFGGNEINLNCLDVESCADSLFVVSNITNNINLICTNTTNHKHWSAQGACNGLYHAQFNFKYSNNIIVTCSGYDNCPSSINASTSNNLTYNLGGYSVSSSYKYVYCPYQTINSCNIFCGTYISCYGLKVWVPQNEYIYGYLNIDNIDNCSSSDYNCKYRIESYCYTSFDVNLNSNYFGKYQSQSTIEDDICVYGYPDSSGLDCCPWNQTLAPTIDPTSAPTPSPTDIPSMEPSKSPTPIPTSQTNSPSNIQNTQTETSNPTETETETTKITTTIIPGIGDGADKYSFCDVIIISLITYIYIVFVVSI